MSTNQVSFTFRAELTAKSTSGVWNDDIAERVLQWYKGYAQDFAEDYPNMVLTYLGDNIYSGVFDQPYDTPVAYNPAVDLLTFVDPDEDGNHPLMVNNCHYIVVGTLTTVNGAEVSDYPYPY